MNTAIKPVLRYVGSKYYIRKDILKILESVPHQTFVEVFGGSGIITACKDPVKQEVYNGYNKHVSTFFSVLVDPGKFDELKKRLEFLTYNEKIFKDAKAALATDDGTLSDVEIAFCLFVTSVMGFSGKQLAPSFGVTVTNRNNGSELLNKIKYIKQWHERFTRVQITNKDWRYCLRHFDREYVLFYLDPPYVPSTRVPKIYKYELTRGDHEELVGLILTLKGKCVLSGYKNEITNRLKLTAGSVLRLTRERL